MKNKTFIEFFNNFESIENLQLLKYNCQDIYKCIYYLSRGQHHFETKISNDEEINKLIRKYCIESYKTFEKLFNEFSANNSEILDSLGTKIFTMTNFSNIRRYCSRHNINANFDEVKNIRNSYYKYLKPTIKDLCKFFNISLSSYKRHVNF